jgi:hypothetical protein
MRRPLLAGPTAGLQRGGDGLAQSGIARSAAARRRRSAVRASRLWPSDAAVRRGTRVDTGQDRAEGHEFGEIGGARLGPEPRVELRTSGPQAASRGGKKADEERASHDRANPQAEGAVQTCRVDGR